jgi:hypothetical protein
MTESTIAKNLSGIPPCRCIYTPKRRLKNVACKPEPPRILAGAAAFPTLAVPALASGTPDDPIFALIEQHRMADRACDATDKDQDIPDELGEQLYQCKVRLAITKPTTLGGVIAVLRYQHEVSDSWGVPFFDAVGEAGDPRCDVQEWLVVIEQSLNEIRGAVQSC